ncbi:hypothetical protein D3C76_1795500 [compost metagenome]
MLRLGDLVFDEQHGMVEQGLLLVVGVAGQAYEALDPAPPVQVIGLHNRFIDVP